MSKVCHKPYMSQCQKVRQNVSYDVEKDVMMSKAHREVEN